MKQFALAFLLLAFAVAPSHAVPQITVTGCDTLSTAPLRVRTTFTVDVPATGPWCDFLLYGDAATGTQVFDCAAPAGFTCEFVAVGYPQPTGDYMQNGRCFHSGDHFDGFQIVADRSGPCVVFKFYGPLLLQGSKHDVVEGLDGSYVIRGCLVKDAPTPAMTTSWGSVKFLYR